MMAMGLVAESAKPAQENEAGQERRFPLGEVGSCLGLHRAGFQERGGDVPHAGEAGSESALECVRAPTGVFSCACARVCTPGRLHERVRVCVCVRVCARACGLFVKQKQRAG